MLHPNTGIEFGKEIDELRKENVALREALNISPESLARCFHHHYERLAPEYGYETREDSRVGWDSLPRENKGLMTETAKEVLAELRRRAGREEKV